MVQFKVFVYLVTKVKTNG